MNDEKDSHGSGVAGASQHAILRNVPIHRILVADDENSMRRMIAETLGRRGYQVNTAENGAAAWDILQFRKDYDLLVTDNNMPVVSGLELVRKLRAARMALPVILVSGMMPHDELLHHPGLALSATLAKPFTGEELLTTVEIALRSVGKEGNVRTLRPRE